MLLIIKEGNPVFYNNNNNNALNKCDRTPLMLAVTNGHGSVVQVLVDQGAQLDYTDKYMCTALHRAVSYK